MEDETIRGLSTFVNNGKNICFLNTALQCLMHLDPVNTKLAQLTDNPTQNDSFITYYVNVLRIYWEDNGCILPESFLELFAKSFPGYEPGSQNDAYEALTFIIDQLHEAHEVHSKTRSEAYQEHQEHTQILVNHRTNAIYKRRFTEKKVQSLIDLANKQWIQQFKHSSPILEHLVGQEHQRIQCMHCRTVRHQFFAFNHISLPIISGSTKGPNLRQLFDAYCDKDYYDQDNQVLCEHCNKKSQAAHKTIFWFLPEYLIIVLKRFTQNRYGQFVKNTTAVDFPVNNLDLHEYLSCPDRDPFSCTEVRRLAIYDLMAVGVHQGFSFLPLPRPMSLLRPLTLPPPRSLPKPISTENASSSVVDQLNMKAVGHSEPSSHFPLLRLKPIKFIKPIESNEASIPSVSIEPAESNVPAESNATAESNALVTAFNSIELNDKKHFAFESNVRLGAGHYWALIKCSDNNFYRFDDEQQPTVVPIEQLSELGSSAYFLIYRRK